MFNLLHGPVKFWPRFKLCLFQPLRPNREMQPSALALCVVMFNELAECHLRYLLIDTALLAKIILQLYLGYFFYV